MQTAQGQQLIGMTLGEYRVEQLLGCGNVTAVYLAHDLTQERQAMITTFLMPDTFSASARDRFVARFLREGATLAQLSHAHILPLYAIDEQLGYPYLVTPFVKDNSLAIFMKDHPHFTAEQTFILLKQIASALDTGHAAGVYHGALTPASILLTEKQGVWIAGFGFTRLLALQGIVPSTQPYAHLFNIVGTLLCPLSVSAPELLQGAPIDARTDVYALGILLFQLLGGTLPFPQVQSVEAAIQAIGQPVPALHALAPDMPAGLELVVQRALEPEPLRRFQSASEVAQAYERAMRLMRSLAKPMTTLGQEKAGDSQVTLPPTVNWFDEEEQGMGKSALFRSLTGKQQPMTSSSSDEGTSGWQLRPPIVTGQLSTVKDAMGEVHRDTAGSVDPFVWWSTVSLGQGEGQAAGTFRARTVSLGTAAARARRRQPSRADRRRTIAMLAGGGVAVVGVLGIGGLGLAHFLQRRFPPQTAVVPPASTQATAPTQGVHTTPTVQTAPTHAPTPKPTAQPTGQPTAQPTTPPTPTPAPTTAPTPTPSHTGTVIGSTSMPTNSEQGFTNPADGKGSLLIHLLNGNFVAYESTCTHESVTVNYDPNSHLLICPRHGARYDPANGATVVQGPAPRALPGVTIRVNADGTITTG